MKFGRIPLGNLSKVDLSLPEDSHMTEAVLKQPSSHNLPSSIYIGCSVWTDRSFVGKIYPPRTATTHFLPLYCRQFNTVELNATFYGIPSTAQVRKWRSAATPGFKFCPKVPKSISQRITTSIPPTLLERFLEAISQFGEALGMTFLQLPPHFKPSDIDCLKRFLALVPQDLALAVECRHPDWFAETSAQQALFGFLRDRGVATVITDVAGRRDVLHQTLTTQQAFIRFVGNNLHPSDYTRIDAWVARLQHWLSQGLEEVYFLLHEPDKALCADLAAYMIARLNDSLGTELTAPHLLDAQPNLFSDHLS